MKGKRNLAFILTFDGSQVVVKHPRVSLRVDTHPRFAPMQSGNERHEPYKKLSTY